MSTRFAFIPNADWKCEGKSIYIEHTHSDIIYIVLSILRTPEVVQIYGRELVLGLYANTTSFCKTGSRQRMNMLKVWSVTEGFYRS